MNGGLTGNRPFGTGNALTPNLQYGNNPGYAGNAVPLPYGTGNYTPNLWQPTNSGYTGGALTPNKRTIQESEPARPYNGPNLTNPKASSNKIVRFYSPEDQPSETEEAEKPPIRTLTSGSAVKLGAPITIPAGTLIQVAHDFVLPAGSIIYLGKGYTPNLDVDEVLSNGAVPSIEAPLAPSKAPETAQPPPTMKPELPVEISKPAPPTPLPPLPVEAAKPAPPTPLPSLPVEVTKPAAPPTPLPPLPVQVKKSAEPAPTPIAIPASAPVPPAPAPVAAPVAATPAPAPTNGIKYETVKLKPIKWYRPHNKLDGPSASRCLGLDSAGTPRMAATTLAPGQHWQFKWFEDTDNWNIYNLSAGAGKRFDSLATDQTQLTFSAAADSPGQTWKIRPWNDGSVPGSCFMFNLALGDQFCADAEGGILTLKPKDATKPSQKWNWTFFEDITQAPFLA